MTDSYHDVLLYDGLCGLCNGLVRWAIAHDDADRLRFAPQQSAVAETLLARHGVSVASMIALNSVYLVLRAGAADETLLTQSDVPAEMLRQAGGGWRWAGRAFAAIPLRLRNAMYRTVARNRFRISGRYEVCPVPSERQRAKFLWQS